MPEPLSQPNRGKRLVIAASVAVLSGVLGLAGTIRARQASPSAAPERAAEKAMLLFEMTRFVEWPASAFAGTTEPFVIGVLGEDPLRKDLDAAVAGRQWHGRAIRVRRFRNLDEVDPCQLLFVARNKARLLPSVLEFLDGTATLTVGDREGFAEQGGMVALLERSDHIAFEVNLRAVERSGLRVSSEMLRIADRIWPEPPAGRAP